MPLIPFVNSVEEKKKSKKKFTLAKQILGVTSKKRHIKVKEMKGKHGIIVKRQATEEDMIEWLQTEAGFIEGLTNVHGENTTLYDYQLRPFNQKKVFEAEAKSRQIGFSWGYSAASLARTQLYSEFTGVFVSYLQSEANEKILYARTLYESLPLAFKKKRIVDNKQSLEFEDNKGNRTRLISFPQRPPRGKGHNTFVLLDEIAHFTWPDQIYEAALPIITRGTGKLTVASSPLGAKGLFYDIFHKKSSFINYGLSKIYWWDCPDFCNDVEVARKIAPLLPTHERIRRFANPKLIELFHAFHEIDSFQQEFEIAWIDEATAFITLEAIRSVLFEKEKFELEGNIDPDNDVGKVSEYPIVEKYPDINFKTYKDIDELIISVKRGDITPNLVAGFDVGRRRDASELYVFEEIGDVLVERLALKWDKKQYVYQKSQLHTLLRYSGLKRFGIDCQGIGSDMAEELADTYPMVVEPIKFVPTWKERAAIKVKLRVEASKIAISESREVVEQIHSIKKTVTDQGNVRYDAAANKEHHGDKFWSIAIACDMAKELDFGNVAPFAEVVIEPRVFQDEQSIDPKQTIIHHGGPLGQVGDLINVNIEMNKRKFGKKGSTLIEEISDIGPMIKGL